MGAKGSRLFRMLESGHYGVKLPAADLHRITLWLDCGSDFYGAFENIEAQARGDRIAPEDCNDDKDLVTTTSGNWI